MDVWLTSRRRSGTLLTRWPAALSRLSGLAADASPTIAILIISVTFLVFLQYERVDSRLA